MITLRKLLDRIRWDDEFGKGTFRLGYYDRVEGRILYIDLERIYFTDGDHFAFDAVDPRGNLHNIPFHRVRQVRRNGELIWERPLPNRS